MDSIAASAKLSSSRRLSRPKTPMSSVTRARKDIAIYDTVECSFRRRVDLRCSRLVKKDSRNEERKMRTREKRGTEKKRVTGIA